MKDRDIADLLQKADESLGAARGLLRDGYPGFIVK